MRPGPKPQLVLDRFWKYVDQHGPIAALEPSLGRCWIWTGARLPSGYGNFTLTGPPRRVVVIAHKFLWEITNHRVVPKGQELDHFACERRECCNPTHVRPVTRRENQLRSKSTHAAVNLGKTHCPQQHPYDEANTYVVPSTGDRKCRSCIRERSRLAYQRRRDKKG